MQDNEIYYREEAVQDWFYDRIEYGTFDESTTKNLTWAWGVIDDMVPMYYDHRLNVFLYRLNDLKAELIGTDHEWMYHQIEIQVSPYNYGPEMDIKPIS